MVARIRALADAGDLQLTTKASAEADDLGFSRDYVREIVAGLRIADYAGRVASNGEWLYVFTPEVEGLLLYVKLVLRARCVIVSFHEDQDEDEEAEEVGH